jgi:hypothetical protein
MDKVRATVAEAVADVSSGATLAVGGFGTCTAGFVPPLCPRGAASRTACTHESWLEHADTR